MKAKDLGYIAVSAAILTVSAWIAVPIGSIPITLQTAALFLIAGVLGWKRATLATLAYLLLGMIGVPVFAGFMGGISVIFSPTGGYLLGFFAISLIVGVIAEKNGEKFFIRLIVAMYLGLLLCYTIGTAWFMLFIGENMGFIAAITLCVLPYLPFDVVKMILSVFLIVRVKKILKMA